MALSVGSPTTLHSRPADGSWPPWLIVAVWEWCQSLQRAVRAWCQTSHYGAAHNKLLVSFVVFTGLVPPHGVMDRCEKEPLYLPEKVRQLSIRARPRWPEAAATFSLPCRVLQTGSTEPLEADSRRQGIRVNVPSTQIRVAYDNVGQAGRESLVRWLKRLQMRAQGAPT